MTDVPIFVMGQALMYSNEVNKKIYWNSEHCEKCIGFVILFI